MNIVKNLIVLLAALFAFTDAANILGLFTSSSPSHVIIHMAVVKSLIQQGHNVTVVTSIPLKDKNKEYKHLFLHPGDDVNAELERRLAAMSNTTNPLDKMDYVMKNIKSMANLQYDAVRGDEFQSLIKTEKFDLVMIGYFFNDYMLAVAAQLKVPVVLSWTGPPIGFINSYLGNPTEGSYVPNMLVSSKQPMNFKDRIVTFLADVMFYGLQKFGNYKYQQYYE